MATAEQLLVRIDATTEQLRREFARADDAINRFDRTSRQSLSKLDGTLRKLDGAFVSLSRGLGVFVGGLAVGQVVRFGAELAKTADQLRLLEERVRVLGGTGQTFEQLRQISLRLGTTVESTASAFSRFRIAGDDIGLTNRQVLTLTETVQKLGRIGGSSGQELAAATTQFAQGLAKGRLDGDELRSVLENLPLLGRAIADSLGVGVGQLRDMGAEGKLTGQVISNAVLAVARETDEQFQKLPRTLEQAATNLETEWGRLVTALDDRLSISQTFQFFTEGLARGIGAAADAVAGASAQQRLQSTLDQIKAIQDQIERAERDAARPSERGLQDPRRADSDRTAEQRIARLRQQAELLAQIVDLEAAAAAAAENREADERAATIVKQAQDRAKAVTDYVKALQEEVNTLKLSEVERVKRAAADKAEADARKKIAGITDEQIAVIREAAAAAAAEGLAIEKTRKVAEADAKARDSLNAARVEAIGDLQDELRYVTDLAEANELGAEAVFAVETARKAELIVQRLKLKDTDIEIGLVEELVQRIEEQRRKIEQTTQAQREAERAAERLAEKQKRAAEEAAREYEKVLDRIRDFSEEALGDSFFDILRGETVDFAEFFETTILRTVANVLASIATQQIVLPIATQLVGGLPGLFGLTGQAAGVAGAAAGGGLFGNPLSSLGNIASLVTGGPSSLATGFVTSQIGAALGLSSTVGPATALGVAAVPGGLSAAAGGAAGGVLAPTAAGSALIGAAPFLGIAALAAPLLLGSLFGRNPSVGPTGVARIPNVIGTSEIVGSTDNGGDSSAAETVAQSIRDIATSAAETLGFFGQRAFGLDVGNFPQPEDGSSQAAGFNLKRIVDNILESSDFATGLTAEQAVTEGVRETLQRAFDGVDVPQIATALENSSAETIEELLSDLDLANAIGTFAAGGREALEELTRPLTAVEQAFQNLADAAEEGTERAQELGLSVDEATAYFDDLRAQLEETTQAAFTARERELSGQGFLNQVQALLDQRATDARDAVAAGLDVNSTAGNLFNLGLAQVLEQLTEAQRAIIASTFTDQQIQDAITVFNDFAAANDNVASTMADFADELQASIASIDDEISARQQSVDDLQRLVTGLQQGRIGRAINPELSIFDPQEQFRIAMEEFTRISGLAAGGDLEAVAQFDDVANATLQSALAAFGRSDSRFAQVFNQIQSSSLQVEDLTVTQIGIAQQQLNELQSIREALGAQSTSQQDLGSRPTRNRILADLTGYTGDFGGGGFQQFLATAGLPQGILDSVNQVISAIPFANGGIMTSRGPLPLHTYASGGIADAPQLAMFGEGRMPEAFVPLPNGRSIPVQFQGGGGANDNRMVGLMERLVEVNEALVRVVGAGNEEMAEQSTLLRREIRRYAQEVRAAG